MRWCYKTLRSSCERSRAVYPKVTYIYAIPGVLLQWHKRHSPYYKSVYHQNDFEAVI